MKGPFKFLNEVDLRTKTRLSAISTAGMRPENVALREGSI
jgi:hypothetical protein